MNRRKKKSPRLFSVVRPDSQLRFDEAMPVAELIEAHYVPHAESRRVSGKWKGTKLSHRRIEQLSYLARMMQAYLHRMPTVADLKPETLDGFFRWHGEAFPRLHGQSLAKHCRALLLFCRFIPQTRGRKPPTLSEEPGTLWAIVVGDFFKRNLSIRTHKTRMGYRRAVADLMQVTGHEPTAADLTDANIERVAGVALESGRANARTVRGRVARLNYLKEYVSRIAGDGGQK